ncbi:sensor histidine kinase [Pseudoduganella namucuonensis]|uniref:Two component regulator propeller n=1 Tax=Pseudoduganella namucuonensis TaxID=1035707 RepID=A0A1I7GWN4_9BURK|nr:sensor histidine kinase [Pseudoduganella namucuonensis]SFU52830.1 Two component regulator propeller [Pseudoduganella namucuonensis]
MTVPRLLLHAAATALFALHSGCPAAPPGPLLSDYTHTAWGGLQAAPVDVLKFAQGPDGWLWMATPTGLYRYDGVRFERADAVHGRPLHSSNVLGLMAGADGALWVGYRLGGVTVFRPDGARTFMEAEGLPGGAVFHIAAAPDGAVWVATRDGLARLAPGAARFEPQGKEVGLPERRIFQILYGRDGTQWIAALAGVYFRKPGETRFTHAWPRKTLMAMAEAPDGAIWAADAGNHYHRVATAPPAGPAGPAGPGLTGTGMHFGRDGAMWLLRADGVERKLDMSRRAAPAQRLTRQNGISGPLPQAFFQDREGNVWIGTSAGVDRLRPNRLATLPVDAPLDHPGMVPGPDRDVWVGDYAGHVRSFTAAGAKRVEIEGPLSASFRAPDGTLWIGNERWLHRRAPGGALTRFAPPPGVRGLDPQAMQQDRDGALWVSFSGGGLFRLADGRWTRHGGLSGFPAALAMTMALDARGALWMGHARNQVSLVEHGKVRVLGAAEGLDLGTLLQLRADGELMWAGGESGTALYRAGRFTPLRGRGGEAFRGVSGIARTADGDLWLHGADGIHRVGAAGLARWMAGADAEIEFERFDALDGLRGTASQLRPNPSLIQAPDGQLWFSTGSNIAMLDPARIRRNPLAPAVLIRDVTAAGRHYPAGGGAPLELPKGSDSLQVAFTALSLSMPERVRFRYRLEGVDRDWQEPVGRREAFYTNLAPGAYRFQVTAANEDGVWNREGATLDIRIPPKFAQTPWFALLLALAGAALAYAAYALRIRHLTRRMRERLRERLAERSRIARALHDTLLQSVQGLIMSFHAHTHLLPEGTRERARLDQTLNLADRLLVEGRDQIMDLRAAASPDELGLALREFGKGLSEHRAHAFEAHVGGRRRPLQPKVQDEIYAIAREALFNASRYAEAGRITLELDYDADVFTLRVRDDGRGLDEAVARAGHRPGHWGLVGMRERAAGIGATLRLRSEPGAGTEIEVALAAELAYLAGRSALRGDGRRRGPLARWLRR